MSLSTPAGAPAARRPRSARDWWLWPVAAVAGLLFFVSLGRLWPLADTDLTVLDATLTAQASDALLAAGIVDGPEALARYRQATAVEVDEPALDWVERSFGTAGAQALVRAGAALVRHDVLLRRAGDPDGLAVSLHADGALLGVSRGVQDDAPGARLAVDSARRVAARAMRGLLRVDASPTAPAPGDTLAPEAAPAGDPAARWATASWRETGASARERPARTDHTFTWERILSSRPELRERAVAVVSGAQVTLVRRWLVVPAAGERAARVRRAPTEALQTVGVALVAVGAIGALAVFLLRLRDGTARLGRAAYWGAIVFACAFLTNALLDYDLLARWDPLWPRWIANLSSLAGRSQGTAWMFVVLFALIAAGDALDREAHGGRAGRGRTLWQLGRGRLTDPAVGLASLRGFAVGLVCGGVMAATVWALVRWGGAYTAVQPRGFFFYALNAAAPSLATLLFFTNVALLEELGYRFFGGTWLLAATRRRWIAVALPALVYGLSHTALDFLPPAEPFWGRALVMTLVGAVWGWAFLRWDALTVVTSHLTADLFIFNWPRLASAHPDVRLAALATVAAPLLPAVVAGVAALARRRRAPQHATSADPTPTGAPP